jgi:NADH-quinone oxidoreductase subunit G
MLVEIEIDGRQIKVPDGNSIIEAAHLVGIYIPHFCYHKKLSVAANCRMCLVEVEKAPKPLPACATPVINGMKVHTHSDLAAKAQKGVMEFLLINHPLDCPICDQGGECQLQDLAVGYGSSASRYVEEKRVVFNKDLGPLISTDMTRCIHCTRCVRFGQEIAGIMELGMANRGEHSEILTFVGKTVDSELSGNVIDLCPVGALTSKPFRFSARTWELSRRKSVSPHDALGANLIVQVKHNKVMRVLPLENDEVNECWLSDKDRFSYEALNSDERLTKPMLKQGGQWREVEWPSALEYVAHGLKDIAAEHGPAAIGALASPHSTLEELHLLQKLIRGLGSDNIDFRLRQSDFSADGKCAGAPWLGMRIAEINWLDRILVIGSFLRKDHPLIAQRLRQATKFSRGQLSVIHVTNEDLLQPAHVRALTPPSQLPSLVAQVLLALAEVRKATPDAALQPALMGLQVGAEARTIANSLVEAKNCAVFLGNLAQQHPQAALLHALAQDAARIAKARLGFFGEAANSVGGYIAGALPGGAGLNAAQMLEQPRKAYLLLHAEPELDCYNPRQALQALGSAAMVVALSPFKTKAVDYADVLLPIAPFSETSGTYINCEGRIQSFNAVVKALEDTRPAWKVLRVLGNLLGLSGFEQESSEALKKEVLGESAVLRPERLNNAIAGVQSKLAEPLSGLERVCEVPIYFADPIVRRAPALQRTRDARPPRAGMSATTLERIGISAGEAVRVRQGPGEAVLEAALDDTVADGGVRVAAAHPSTAGLGEMHASITVERA